MAVEIGDTISIRNAFSSKSSPGGCFDRITGVVVERDGESLALLVRQFGHRELHWSPEDGGYIENEIVTQAVSILAKRGIQVSQQTADWVSAWFELDDLKTTPELLAFEILIHMYCELENISYD
jgi:hypothetical protein